MKTLKQSFSGIVLPVLICVLMFNKASAQSTITEKEKKEILDKAFVLLKENYIFPEKVAPMEKTLRKKLAEGYYAQYTNTNEFLKNLNHDMETLVNDRHVNIFFDSIRVKQIRAEAKGTYTQPSYSPEFLKRARYENNMVRKVERLDGNVGYLKIDMFIDSRIAKPTFLAAMSFLSNSDALIIDLRQNGGGNANAVSFLMSYFLPDSTLVSQFTSRLTKTTENVYIERDEDVKKFANNIPLYVLVSKRTSSAAEAFAYQLQAFKRAVVVGDTTNGEANPGYAFALTDNLWMMVPTSVNVNAVTKTNWQGIGVSPDIVIKSENALNTALSQSYKQLASAATSGEVKKRYEWLAADLEAKPSAAK
jgi:C-terminal processing protease CtpA/Prc